jgi:hypothetical protein
LSGSPHSEWPREYVSGVEGRGVGPFRFLLNVDQRGLLAPEMLAEVLFQRRFRRSIDVQPKLILRVLRLPVLVDPGPKDEGIGHDLSLRLQEQREESDTVVTVPVLLLLAQLAEVVSHKSLEQSASNERILLRIGSLENKQGTVR